MSSEKKIKANQQNSQDSTGPTTPEGKDRSRRNAIQSGLFCRDLIIASAGERQEDFDGVLSDLRDLFPPQDVLTGFFVADTAGMLWRLLRIRRYETAEIRKQCDTARYRRDLEKLSEVNSLKMHFALECAALWVTAPRSAERMALTFSVEETRRQLERTTLGLDFLLEQIEGIRKMVETDGYLSAQNVDVLIRVWGGGDQSVGLVGVLNETAKAEMEKFKNDGQVDRTRFEETKQSWSTLFKYKIEGLEAMKALIMELESVEEEACFTALVMPPPEVVEKINRAETPLRRHLFKNMDTLVDVIYGN